MSLEPGSYLVGKDSVLTSGASQGMLMSDLVSDRGWHPANFADASGGGSSDTVQALVELVFERARRDDVRGIAGYFVTSATPIERVVTGPLDALRRCPPPKPIALGLSSSGAAVATMSVVQAHAAMRAAGFPCVTTPEQVIDRLAAFGRALHFDAVVSLSRAFCRVTAAHRILACVHTSQRWPPLDGHTLRSWLRRSLVTLKEQN